MLSVLFSFLLIKYMIVTFFLLQITGKFKKVLVCSKMKKLSSC